MQGPYGRITGEKERNGYDYRQMRSGSRGGNGNSVSDSFAWQGGNTGDAIVSLRRNGGTGSPTAPVQPEVRLQT